jgi:hypothetical protein
MEAAKPMRAAIQHGHRLEWICDLGQVLFSAKYGDAFRPDSRDALALPLLRHSLGTFAMTDFGKLLIVLGGILLAVGVVLVLLGRTNLPIGRLPGDILYRGKNTTFYFPLATSIVLSVLLSLILYVIGRWRR